MGKLHFVRLLFNSKMPQHYIINSKNYLQRVLGVRVVHSNLSLLLVPKITRNSVKLLLIVGFSTGSRGTPGRDGEPGPPGPPGGPVSISRWITTFFLYIQYG
jgi:hypothetical protein